MTETDAAPVAIDSTVVHKVAKAAWFAPALLLFLTINQVLVAIDIADTLENGTRAVATSHGLRPC